MFINYCCRLTVIVALSNYKKMGRLQQIKNNLWLGTFFLIMFSAVLSLPRLAMDAKCKKRKVSKENREQLQLQTISLLFFWPKMGLLRVKVADPWTNWTDLFTNCQNKRKEKQTQRNKWNTCTQTWICICHFWRISPLTVLIHVTYE